MFDNIGSKIIKVANITTTIGIVCSCILGIGILLINPILGLLIAGIGSLFSWLGSLVLYGFGHLICQVDILVQREASNDKNTNEEKLVNEESEDSKAEMRRHAMSEKCNSFERTGKHSRGMCLLCYEKDKPLELCKIIDDIGTREWPICDKCIKTFENKMNQ